LQRAVLKVLERRADAAVLSQLNLRKFYSADPEEAASAVAPFLSYRGVGLVGGLGVALFTRWRNSVLLTFS